MVPKIPNLWPEDLGADLSVMPRAILERQAQVLAERSKNGIGCDIASRMLGNDLVHTFSIVVPGIEHFRYFVARVRHNVLTVYPVTLYASEQDNVGTVCADEAAFLAALRAVLHDARTVGVVRSLLAQAPAQV